MQDILNGTSSKKLVRRLMKNYSQNVKLVAMLPSLTGPSVAVATILLTRIMERLIEPSLDFYQMHMMTLYPSQEVG